MEIFLKATRITFLLMISVVIPVFTLAQDQREGKEVKYHKKALAYYNASAYEEALSEVGKALKINNTYIEAWLLSGDIHAILGNTREAISSYQKAIAIDHNFFPPAVYILANLQFGNRQYRDCIENYEWYLRYPEARNAEKNRSMKNLGIARFRLAAMENPVPFNPVNAGPAINTEGYEFVNSITPDGSALYFTRRMTTGRALDEDFFVAKRQSDDSWFTAGPLGPPVNTEGDEGALCISPDGQLLFFSACNRPDGYGSCDLYFSKKEGSGWGIPQNLGPAVNSQYWESQPAFSPDGKTLIFVSNRPGGSGSSDLWISRMKADETWTVPQNAGPVINTPESERAPFIHPDGQTLYFSSKGHPGMGEGDIFFSRAGDAGQWSQPVNLGYPLNTEEDEVTFLVDNEGKYAYFSSAAKGGYGLQDIYRAELPEGARPLPVTYMKGIVSDSITGRLLGASFTLTDLRDGREVVQSQSDPVTGDFLVCIPSGRNYALTVEKKGYLFYSVHFELKSEAGIQAPYLRNVLLKPIREGEAIVLRNIFFETDSARLLPESETELNVLFDLLKRNQGLKIEITGHTDNSGTPAWNRQLSESRARSVYDYLVNRGIDGNRLRFSGAGAERPVADNSTPEGRAMNRRTEFRVTGLN